MAIRRKQYVAELEKQIAGGKGLTEQAMKKAAEKGKLKPSVRKEPESWVGKLKRKVKGHFAKKAKEKLRLELREARLARKRKEHEATIKKYGRT